MLTADIQLDKEADSQLLAQGPGMPLKLSLSVLIPAFNERDTIQQALARVRELGPEVEIVVVDDASTDGTSEILEALTGIVLVRHPVNQGKGMAIRTALQHAT